MKHNKLLTLSLLASFLILVSASFSFAQSVTYGTVSVCPQPAGNKVYIPVNVENGVNLAALDIVGQVVTTDGALAAVVTNVTFEDRLGLADILDLRYGLSFCDGGEFRFGAVKLTGTDLTTGSGQIATLELEFTSECELGTVTVGEATADCGVQLGISTAFVGTDATPITPAVVAGAVNMVNADPLITVCPTEGFEIYWSGGSVNTTIEAEDDDLECECDELSFDVTEGPGSITDEGVYTFFSTSSDIGCQDVEITVSDLYGGTAICTFQISVLNMPPEFTVCPAFVHGVWDMEFSYALDAEDPDGGPSGLTYDVLDFDGPGNFDVDDVSGEVTWTIEMLEEYLGDFTASIVVTDGAPLDECNLLNADTCTFDIHVSGFYVTIQKHEGDATTNYMGVLQGHEYDLSVYLDEMFLGNEYLSDHIGGFDLLFAYDASALTLLGAEAGDLLVANDWEYFTYRFGPFGNCTNGCPSGEVRIVAMAETNDGVAHPDPIETPGELAKLTFFITNDRTFECQYAPVQFFWYDCGDNTFSSYDGSFLFVGDKVATFEHILLDPATTEWGYYGTEEECFNTMILDPEGTLKNYPLNAICFANGGFDIICADDIDDPGDINQNGIAYEIADAVMFTNYFVNGLSAFDDHAEASIAASDCNQDGYTLSVADLVYLIRVITGDALPYAKLNHGEETLVVTSQVLNGTMNVGVDREAGATLLVFSVDGSVGEVSLANDNSGMEVLTSLNDKELRVLVYNIGRTAIQAGNLVTLPVNGNVELVSVEAADYEGNSLGVTLAALPTEFDLGQNYPNPFNPKTNIALSLPVASDYSVAIYNVAGQLVWGETGYAQAGTKVVEWFGTDMNGNQVASGVYFYKATASQFSATKKMILMK